MKKMNNIAIIAMALAMAMALVVPVFAVSANQNTFTNEIVGDTTTSIPVIEIVENDNVGYITNDTIVNDEIVENDNVGSITNDSIVSDEIVESDDVHVCSITKANENRHIIDCDDCGEYEYVRHDAENMVISAKNEFFHIYECEVCGFVSSETHSFATAYDAEGHQEVCVDCGYAKEEEAHNFENDFYGSSHDIQCECCGYLAAHHVGVKFETIDAYTCSASCKQCGITEVVDHSFNGFSCRNCNFVVDGVTYAIVDNIIEYDDGSYRVRFMSNGNTHRVTMESVNFHEGDFVKINHYGDEIYEVSVMVDGGIVDNPNEFTQYIFSTAIYERDYNSLMEITISTIGSWGSDDCIYWGGNRATILSSDYVVYDMINCEIGELREGYAYISFHANDTRYFICIW